MKHLLILLSVGLAWSAYAAERPNILLCIADDASWHHFGANGDKVCRTPNFDRVAREGVNFKNVFCSAASCTPSGFETSSRTAGPPAIRRFTVTWNDGTLQ